MATLFIFGLGYTASRMARHLAEEGWEIVSTGSSGTLAFDDRDGIEAELRRATHILSSVPPADQHDPVIAHYGDAIRAAPARWIGYFSATGVYGDTGGAWVDESAPIGHGRRGARAAADIAWQDLGPPVHVFRLPGIYGPGRSALDRIRDGRARRIDLPDQVFSRIHVDDIIAGAIASFDKPAGIYNLADDRPCPQNEVIEAAAALLGIDPPPLQSLEQAALSPAALAFYSENRRIANGKAKRLLGWAPLYRDYRAGLAACHAEESRAQGEHHSP